jgi:DNA gyrase/topoisomerase IV subunit A
MITEESLINIDHQASNIVLEDSMFYISYLAESKLAHRVDGLKNIYRRILWSFYLLQTKGSYILPNFQKMLGAVMEFHPHGDAQIKESIDRFSQNSQIEKALIRTDGSEGSYVQEKGAEARYRKVGLSDFAYDLFFSKIDISSIPMKKNDNLISDEPIYLVGRIPTNLWLYNFTVGSGFKSICPPRSLNNICDIVKYYINHKDPITNTIKIHSKFLKLFIPSFPIYNTIRNANQIYQNYHEGNFNSFIMIDGWLTLTNDSIVVHTFPYGISYKNVKEDIITKASTKGHWLNDSIISIKDLSNALDYSNFTIVFKRNIDIFKCMNKFKDEFKFTHFMYPSNQFTDEYGKIYQMNPIELLCLWYQIRKTTYLNFIKRTQLKYEKDFNDLSAALAVVDHKEEVIRIIKDVADTNEHAIQLLQKRFNISYYKANLILHLNLNVLIKTNKIELLDKINSIHNNIQISKTDITNIDNLMYKDAEYFQKTYSTKNKTRISEYIGYVFFPDKQGYVQFDTIQELYSILNTFSNSLGYITFYHSKYVYYTQTGRIGVFNSNKNISMPQYAYVSNVLKSHILCSNTLYLNTNTNTLNSINRDTTKISCTEGEFIGVSKEFYVIRKDGSIVLEHIRNISVKDIINDKTTSSYKNVLSIIPKEIFNNQDYIFITYTDSDFSNNIYIQPIFLKEIHTKNLIFSVHGKIYIHDISTNFKNIISLNNAFKKKTNVKYVNLINNISIDNKIQNDLKKGYSLKHPHEINLNQLTKNKSCFNMLGE